MRQKTRLRRGAEFLRGNGIGRLDRYIDQEAGIGAHDGLTACRTYRSDATIRDMASLGVPELFGHARMAHKGRRERTSRWVRCVQGIPYWLDERRRAKLVSDMEAGPEGCGFETAPWIAKLADHIRLGSAWTVPYAACSTCFRESACRGPRRSRHTPNPPQKRPKRRSKKARRPVRRYARLGYAVLVMDAATLYRAATEPDTDGAERDS